MGCSGRVGLCTAARLALLSVIMATAGSAQTIAPVNDTGGFGSPNSNDPQLAIAHSPQSQAFTIFPVVPVTEGAAEEPATTSFRGSIVLANASSQLSLDSADVAFISCDPYTGNLQPSNVFATATARNVSAIVLYSETAPGCVLSSSYMGAYQSVYTMLALNDTKEMLNLVDQLNTGNGPQAAYALIAYRDALTDSPMNSGSNNSTSNGSNTNPLGPAPSTAVAMIILYSITGVITALFLIVIITGAVRAHRHPERYGPRNIVGRPRQSRARGLAMAMLETIPIVKFGEREQESKPTDVELESGRHGRVELLPGEDAIGPAPRSDVATGEVAKDVAHETNKEPETPAVEDGIGGAVANGTPPTTDENQGCSICTEDFQVGEDQRVLPCDHRFHPACVDPWLLNVSGSCPLCRLDLRPAEAQDSPNQPESIVREGEPGGMAPPLANDESGNRRASARRSVLMSIMGARQPERMTQEERVQALRQYRNQHNTSRAGERPRSTAGGSLEGEEEERSTRSRLRNAFRIRTRRTGQHETAVAEEQAPTTTTPAPVEGEERDRTVAGSAGR